jgi:hypothetical protein
LRSLTEVTDLCEEGCARGELDSVGVFDGTQARVEAAVAGSFIENVHLLVACGNWIFSLQKVKKILQGLYFLALQNFQGQEWHLFAGDTYHRSMLADLGFKHFKLVRSGVELLIQLH